MNYALNIIQHSTFNITNYSNSYSPPSTSSSSSQSSCCECGFGLTDVQKNCSACVAITTVCGGMYGRSMLAKSAVFFLIFLMVLMNKILSYFVFGRLAKGHEKSNKGNSAEPFVYGRYAAPHARVCENVLECGYWRGAYERERERESSKLFGTTK